MFRASKAHNLMTRAREDKLNSWQKLQQEIRERAFRGYDFLYLRNTEYLNLFTTLQVNGYKVEYDQDDEMWYCSWA